jgi:hypothetical protein
VNPMCQTHLGQSESATPTGEHHIPPALQWTTQSSTAGGQSKPLNKTERHSSEHNSPLPCGGGWTLWGQVRSQPPRAGWGVSLSLTCRISGGHNTELPYFVGGRANLSKTKRLWKDTAATWWQQKHIWPPWRMW